MAFHICPGPILTVGLFHHRPVRANTTMCTIASLVLTVPAQEAFPLHEAVQGSSSHRPGIRLGFFRPSEPTQRYDMFQSRKSPTPAHFHRHTQASLQREPLLWAANSSCGRYCHHQRTIFRHAHLGHGQCLDSVEAEGQGHRALLCPWHYIILSSGLLSS